MPGIPLVHFRGIFGLTSLVNNSYIFTHELYIKGPDHSLPITTSNEVLMARSDISKTSSHSQLGLLNLILQRQRGR